MSSNFGSMGCPGFHSPGSPCGLDCAQEPCLLAAECHRAFLPGRDARGAPQDDGRMAGQKADWLRFTDLGPPGLCPGRRHTVAGGVCPCGHCPGLAVYDRTARGGPVRHTRGSVVLHLGCWRPAVHRRSRGRSHDLPACAEIGSESETDPLCEAAPARPAAVPAGGLGAMGRHSNGVRVAAASGTGTGGRVRGAPGTTDVGRVGRAGPAGRRVLLLRPVRPRAGASRGGLGPALGR